MADATDADIVVLNECEVPIGDTLSSLQAMVDQRFFVPISNSEDRFHCFSKNSSLDLLEIHKGFRTSTRRLNLGSKKALLGLVHGLDMRNYDLDVRQSYAQQIAEEIKFIKNEHETNHLILMGDFNINPHDRVMNAALGFNAMMSRECVSRGHRTFLGEKYEFFYNPMWNLLGDETDGPSGTVYDTSSQGPYGWSMLDQVIINHSLVNEFCGIQILTHAGTTGLTDSRGRPDSINSSDHFPILVKLKENTS